MAVHMPGKLSQLAGHNGTAPMEGFSEVQSLRLGHHHRGTGAMCLCGGMHTGESPCSPYPPAASKGQRWLQNFGINFLLNHSHFL